MWRRSFGFGEDRNCHAMCRIIQDKEWRRSFGFGEDRNVEGKRHEIYAESGAGASASARIATSAAK